MRRKTLKLNSAMVHAAIPVAKPYKMADGKGLYLLIKPNGSRYWRLKYRFAGKEKLLALGVFPGVTLDQARKAMEQAREYLRDHQDPAEHRNVIRRIAGTGITRKKRAATHHKTGTKQALQLMTDSGYTAPLLDPKKRLKKETVKAHLPNTEAARFNAFFAAISVHHHAYRVHRNVHEDLATAKAQQRFFAKLGTAADKYNTSAENLSAVLDQAPFNLRQKATEAGVNLAFLQRQMVNLSMLINDIEPSKTQFRPEVRCLVVQVAKAYMRKLKVRPEIRTFRTHQDIPEHQDLAETFVPLLASLLGLSVDLAGRYASKTLPSRFRSKSPRLP